MTPDLTGMVAVVTGASSGIGRATALRLARAGAVTVPVARRRDRLAELRDDISAVGGTGFPLEADLTAPAQPQRVVESVLAEHGRLDILVNCAGIMLVGPTERVPPGDWDRMIDLNLRAVVAMSLASLSHLVESAESGGRGVADVVNISSVSGLVARAGNGGYAATKFGVGALTESLRQEYATRYVRFSVIEPGSTNSELSSHVHPAVMAERRRLMPTLVRMEADDVARMVEFIVTQPRDVAVNEIVVRPTTQP